MATPIRPSSFEARRKSGSHLWMTNHRP